MATEKSINAGNVPIQVKYVDNSKLPVYAAIEAMRNGMKIRKPTAAASPIPMKMLSINSIIIILFVLRNTEFIL